eukprot:TRINITY_DN53724_c0_g2_i1.p1 TRINITY_DN53724_c0_g2~~TRINITY_DN53724_c0_g2_i1.p1  ORF type:complete len:290 (+),score=18.33 TRINITY_DN53724_c0_g2_i1:2-871(+)
MSRQKRSSAVVPRDVWGVVLSFANFFERKYIAALCCQEWEDIIAQTSTPNEWADRAYIVRGLQKMGMPLHNIESFLQQLTTTNSVISGSFVLWCVLGFPPHWTPDDVDVFTPLKEQEDFSSMEKQLYKDKSTEYTHYHNNAYQVLCEQIRTVRTYTLNLDQQQQQQVENKHLYDPWNYLTNDSREVRINTIDLDLANKARTQEEVVSMLNNNFDLAFCKCHFDGEKITCVSPMSVFRKSCVAKVTSSLWRTRLRVKKYRDRGFFACSAVSSLSMVLSPLLPFKNANLSA